MKNIDIVSIRLVRESDSGYGSQKITGPVDSYELVRNFLEDLDREHIIAISLDTKNKPTNINVVSVGSLNASIVHPREVFKVAILSNANRIILAHNHPSGDITPSSEDNKVTQRIKDAGELLGIQLLDHIIVGDGRYFSYKEEDLL